MNEAAPQLLEDLDWMAPGAQGAGHSIWLWIALGAAALLVVAAVFYLRYRRGKGVPFIAPPRPDAVALASLDDLDAMVREGNEREFTQAVSDVVRVYIQGRFGLRAPHRSTEEFLFEASSNSDLSEAHQELLTEFLVQCDQVKFARQSMVVDAMRAMLESARQFVSTTATKEDKPAFARAGP